MQQTTNTARTTTTTTQTAKIDTIVLTYRVEKCLGGGRKRLPIISIYYLYSFYISSYKFFFFKFS